MKIAKHFHSLRSVPFVRDIATMQVGRAVYMGLTLASSVIFARLLGLEGYGLYAIVLSFVSTIKAFTNFGQTAGLQIFFAEEYGRKDKEGMAAVLRNYIHVSAVNALILIILAAVAPAITNSLYHNTTIGQYARLLFLYSAIDWMNGGLLVVLQILRRIRLKTTLEQSAIAAFLALASTSLFLGYGVGGIVTSQLAASILFLPISFVTYRVLARGEHLPRLRDILSVSIRRTAPYFKQGLVISVDKNIGSLYPSGLFFILSLVAPPSAVGIARLSLQLANLPLGLLLPQVIDLSATVLASMTRDKIMAIRRNAAKVIKHALFLHAIISFGAMLAIPILVPLFYGNAYTEAIPTTLWLILLALPAPLTLVNSSLLRLWRKTHYSAVVAAATLCAMWLSIYLITPLTGPQPSFLFAYALGQLLPLFLTGYVFLVLLKPPVNRDPA